ncbi:MAG: hypothetical protein LBQ66_09615 [Planctomycetaceae bacterium]|jgi:hypothetical protein|nr:hypothetical protein [Planctomycetaceae bacterium]
MSSISFSGNYVSSSYYAAAKKQSVATAETTSNNNNLKTASSAGDVLTISEEALDMLNRNGEVLTVSADEFDTEGEAISLEKLEPKQENQRFYAPQTLWEQIKSHSNHLSLEHWAYGISSDDKNIDETSLSNLKYSKYQSYLENADETFAELLKRNNIKLDENEHIELTIDADGNITIGGNISKEKAGNIQSILNGDKSLGNDLLSAHSCRKSTLNGDRRLLVNVILLREYGVSLSDFEINVNDRQLNIKNGNTALLESLCENEAFLAMNISSLLHAQEDNPDSASLPSVTFSFQNGLFVEKGANDATTLNSFASKVMEPWEIVGGKIDYSMTFDDNGRITNIKETSANAKSGSLDFALSYNKASFDKSTWDANGMYFNSEVLRQYVFDRKRLIKYETGKEADVDTFTVGKNKNGNFATAINSNASYNIAKSQSTT